MILSRYSQILISSVVVVVTSFYLSTNPLLAHSGHNHDSSKQKQVIETKEQSDSNSEMDGKRGEKTSSQPSFKGESTPISEGSTVTETVSQPSLITLNLQPGEWVFLLLLTSTLGLFFLKGWMHRGKIVDN